MSKEILLVTLICLSFFACKEENKSVENKRTEVEETKVKPKQDQVGDASKTITIPADYKLLKETKGDLDKDGIEEKVIVYDTPKEIEMGTQREIHILKKKKGNWELWHKSIGAVLSSTHGGMMGDPFEEISIERGCIVIVHFGGSRQKWRYTHRYRYQNNDWELIGATIVYGSPCDYWEDLDYNLSSGDAVYEKEVEDCDADTSELETKKFNMKDEELPKMDGYYPGNNVMKIPGLEAAMYY